ncbi:MAG: ImuA family protein [Candidatus Puniceispirillaceae bacterium]
MVAIQPAPVKISADVSARESAREIAREATGKKNSVFACLKEKIEAQHISDRHYLATGLACFDSALSGGLAHQHVHLMAGPHNDAAATGFIVALLRAQLQQRPNAPIIWCSPRFSGQYGHVCAEGLWAMGLNPGQVIFVHDGHPARLLSAFEEALQTTGVAGVVAEYGVLARKSDQWLRWAQRLRRAARIGDSMGFLLGPPAASTGFESGWSITSKASDQSQKQDWRPRWSVRLTKSRKGHQASADIYYCPVSGRMYLARNIMPAAQSSLPFAETACALSPAVTPASETICRDNVRAPYPHHYAS